MINLEKLFIAAALLCTPLIASSAQAGTRQEADSFIPQLRDPLHARTCL